MLFRHVRRCNSANYNSICAHQLLFFVEFGSPSAIEDNRQIERRLEMTVSDIIPAERTFETFLILMIIILLFLTEILHGFLQQNILYTI